MTSHLLRVFRRVAPPVALAAVLAPAVPLRSQTLPQDEGASGTWQKLQRLQTTASVLHTTAHPDEEHRGMLTMLSRRDGARVTMLGSSAALSWRGDGDGFVVAVPENLRGTR